MDARVHVYSPTLNRNFTFAEWCEWLKENPNSSRKVIVQHSGFNFNVFGVCLTPEVAIMESERGWGFKVLCCQSPNGMWSASHHYFCENNSYGYSPSFVKDSKDGFVTKQLAINNELHRLHDSFVKLGAPAEAIKRVKRMMVEQIATQQTLF